MPRTTERLTLTIDVKKLTKKWCQERQLKAVFGNIETFPEVCLRDGLSTNVSGGEQQRGSSGKHTGDLERQQPHGILKSSGNQLATAIPWIATNPVECFVRPCANHRGVLSQTWREGSLLRHVPSKPETQADVSDAPRDLVWLVPLGVVSLTPLGVVSSCAKLRRNCVRQPTTRIKPDRSCVPMQDQREISLIGEQFSFRGSECLGHDTFTASLRPQTPNRHEKPLPAITFR